MGQASKPWRAGRELAAIWQSGDGLTLALSQATHAFTVMLAVLAARGVDRPQVWLPGYFCNGALVTVRAANARLRFYPVSPTLAPDWPGVEAMLGDGAPQLFVLPHYFGLENEAAAAARAFCDRVGALLHEDAAHVLLPVGRIGTWGDFVSFSPRKYCGIPDGGILVVRGAALAADAERAVASLPSATLPTLRPRLVAWRDRSLPWRRVTGPLPAVDFDADPASPAALPAIWMSAHSRTRLSRLGLGGLKEIAAREAATVGRIEAALSQVTDLAPLPRHPESTPYLLGFRAASSNVAAKLLVDLRRAGALAGSWPGMPPEVRAEPGRHRNALAFRNSVLRLAPRFDRRRRPLDFVAAFEPHP